MPSSIEEIEKTLKLLQVERDEDRKQYLDKIMHASISERKNQGITWYPIVIKDSYYGMGERIIIEIERPGDHNTPHNFQFGCTVSLFSNQPDKPSIQGTVSIARKNYLRISTMADELPEWINMGKLGVDLLFDESSYKEMEGTLKEVIAAKNNRLAQLRDQLLGEKEISFKTIEHTFQHPKLNAVQNKAIDLIQCANDVAVVHGPPGTGKTTTFVQAIIQTLKHEKQILVCSASNQAVDLLTTKLFAEGIKVIRIGNLSRIQDDLQHLSLDAAMIQHKDFKLIKEFKKQADEYKHMANKYKRNFGKEEREQRKTILNEARKLQAEAEKTENFISEDIIQKSQVILATLTGSAHYLIRERNFTTLFIDEAGQAPEPACWIAIKKAQRVIFAGDHKQLPPTIKSRVASEGGLSTTLFEKVIDRQPCSVMLEEQYRMNEKIMGFSNLKFYQNKLTAFEKIKAQCLADEIPLEFIDTAGCSFDEELEKESSSLTNKGEAQLIIKYFAYLFENQKLDTNIDVGLISPYKAQVHLLEDEFSRYPDRNFWPKKININTVDGFQGQERDFICISLVRSNENGEIGFLSDFRRMNVAMTRARKKLTLIGDSATLSRNAFYKDMLEYIERHGYYRTAWEFIS